MVDLILCNLPGVPASGLTMSVRMQEFCQRQDCRAYLNA